MNTFISEAVGSHPSSPASSNDTVMSPQPSFRLKPTIHVVRHSGLSQRTAWGQMRCWGTGLCSPPSSPKAPRWPLTLAPVPSPALVMDTGGLLVGAQLALLPLYSPNVCLGLSLGCFCHFRNCFLCFALSPAARCRCPHVPAGRAARGDPPGLVLQGLSCSRDN